MGKQYDLIDTVDYLLYDILLELKKLNSNSKPEEIISIVKPVVKAVEKPIVKAKPKPRKKKAPAICKYCGKAHEHPWEYMQCAKKYKNKTI